MSAQRGNIKRTRSQKHCNSKSFDNTLHDTSRKMKQINELKFFNVCEHCKNVLEWKVKYKKYKPLTVPKKCVKCEEKTVKSAYYILCTPCSHKERLCGKCGKVSIDIADKFVVDKEEKFKMKKQIQGLSERKRRHFYRFLHQSNFIEESPIKQKASVDEVLSIIVKLNSKEFSEVQSKLHTLDVNDDVLLEWDLSDLDDSFGE